ncbi:MAG: hypothetical protein K2N78_01195 [Oscillospiraceae bacterium]|nr:hypothetical protein [Oscillospiraceae bacterium]
MRSHYKRAMDSITLSPEAVARIQKKLHRSAITKRLRPAVVLAVAAVLALVLGTTAAANGLALHELPAAIVQNLQPVQLSDTDQDISMTVQSATVEDGIFTAYITMTDERGGDRLAQGVDFYDSYRISTPYGASMMSLGCQPLGYDEFSGSYGYLVTIKAKDDAGRAVDFSNRKFTFSARQLLLGQKKAQPVVLSPDWSSMPIISPDAKYYILGGGGEGFESYSGWTTLGEALVLQPGSWEVPVMEGVSISAAGFMGGQFHLQLRFDNNGPDDHGWINLVTPEGETVARLLTLSFRDEGDLEYTECVYDITSEELPGCILSGEFTTGGYLLEGNWKVTFTLSEND